MGLDSLLQESLKMSAIARIAVSPRLLLGALGPSPCRPPTSFPPLLPSLTSTLLPSSSEPALPLWVLLVPALELAQFLAPSSSAMPGTPLSSSSCSRMPSWALPSQVNSRVPYLIIYNRPNKLSNFLRGHGAL